jgi:adenine-specific DNA-methyltransferase
MQGNNYQIDKEPLLELPIYNPPDSIKKPFIELMNNIICLRKEENLKEIKDVEDKINKLMYNLYDLSTEQIKIIENEIYNKEKMKEYRRQKCQDP